MKIVETPLAGALILELETFADERGHFARSFCQRELSEAGVEFCIRQANVSFNHKAGTLRGMHLQVAPSAEAKLVRCVRGRIWDVIVDLRPDSKTFLQSFSVELYPAGPQLLVPEDFAHGFLTLQDASEVTYLMSEFYDPENQRGFRYDDPSFAIEWPREIEVISDRDRALPFFEPDRE